MTGRDYKSLIKIHREINSKLDTNHGVSKHLMCQLLPNSNKLVKYQPVDYTLFKDFINERKEESSNTLNRVKQIEEQSKQKREALLMKHHSSIWLRDFVRLENQSKCIQDELNDFQKLFECNSTDYADLNIDEGSAVEFEKQQHTSRDSTTHHEPSRKLSNEESDEFDTLFKTLELIDELEMYANELNEELIVFKVKTVYPVNDLKEDLQYYLKTNTTESLQVDTERISQISKTIVRVQTQQGKLIQKLEEDFQHISSGLKEDTQRFSNSELIVNEGIPFVAHELDCPDEELKLSVLQEFIIVDFKYKEKLRQLNRNYKHLLDTTAVDNKSPKVFDTELFTFIYELYTQQNIHFAANCNLSRRDLMFDRLKQSFGQKNLPISRDDFLKYEEWLEGSKFFAQQHRLIVNEWNECRSALLTKAEAIFAEAFELVEKRRCKNEEREKQLRICNELYDKVSRWRTQKLEALDIQQKIDYMIKQNKTQTIKMENERREKKRLLEKKAITEYNSRIEAHRQQQEKEEHTRLENIKKSIREQAKADKERINLRNEMHLQRKNQILASKQSKQIEDEQREKRLEQFYESVKPNVDADPARMISFTQAELLRRGVQPATLSKHPNESEKFVDKKNPFNSFTDKQLNSNAFARIEERLRQAGLINNEYARLLFRTKSFSGQNRRNLTHNTRWNGFALDG